MLKQIPIEDIELKYNPDELVELAKEIDELRETYQIVNSLSIQQGERMNQIENEIETMSENVSKSNIELEKAATYQQSTLKKKGVLYGFGILALNIPLAPLMGLQFSIPISLVLTGGYLYKKRYKE